MTWVYPGDSPLAAARRVAWAYRQRLNQVAPGDCEQLDELMRRLGQHWAVPRPLPHDPDEWVSATEAAELAAVQTDTIGNLRRSGRLTGRQTSTHRWQYQVREILALTSYPRRRGTPENRQTSEAAKPER